MAYLSGKASERNPCVPSRILLCFMLRWSIKRLSLAIISKLLMKLSWEKRCVLCPSVCFAGLWRSRALVGVVLGAPCVCVWLLLISLIFPERALCIVGFPLRLIAFWFSLGSSWMWSSKEQHFKNVSLSALSFRYYIYVIQRR